MKKYSHYLLIPLFAVIGALVFVNLFARVDFSIQALHASLSIHPSSSGGTELHVKPVGVVKAHTHRTPVNIDISLENIDLDGLKEILTEGTKQDELIDEARMEVVRAMKKLVWLSIILSFCGGVFGLIILQRRSVKELLLGGLIGFLTVSFLLFGTYKTYDIQRFQSPEYEGMLKAAPWMINLVQESFITVDTWGRQMEGIATNLYGLFRRVESLQAVAPGDGQLKVLHVSDIHNNPAAFDFIGQVVKTFGINLVVDSGDLSDFGTPLEAAFTEKIKDLEVPYVIVPGNHETPFITEELKKTPNLTVLDGEIITVQGLVIAGIGDPASKRNESDPSRPEEHDVAVEKFYSLLERSGTSPDIFVAHAPIIAVRFWGQIPVVLSGHTHRYKIQTRQKSVFINAGTSGASGMGALKTKEEIPYTFVLLHFDRTEDGVRLKYSDTISISNQQSGYSLDRRVYPNLYKPQE
ncbi:MAG: hypothetical protein CVU89_07220 [Firmicutes bacterium HGW-Firmicutes-14]|nr:MAG: hypothetical protein CVU89_07220 [Firmicutes bacterium HGW-Firmicutes-14]